MISQMTYTFIRQKQFSKSNTDVFILEKKSANNSPPPKKQNGVEQLQYNCHSQTMQQLTDTEVKKECPISTVVLCDKQIQVMIIIM